MMLLTIDDNSTIHRLSNEELALDHPWLKEVSSAPEVKFATANLYGGFASPTFGGFSLVPGTTRSRKLGVTVQYTETTEAEAITFIEGSAYRTGFDRYGVNYDLLRADYQATLKANVTGNLQDIFATYCGASHLNRTLNVTGTSRNPAVSYNVTTKTQTIDVLSAIAAFFCHGFYDDGSTIYLYDCLADNGSMSLDEFDFEPIPYSDSQPVSEFVAGDYAVDGSYPLGTPLSINPVCHTAQANIEAALGDIKTIMEQPGAELSLPLCEKVKSIKHGMKLYWTDNSQTPSVTAWIRVQSIAYDFTQDAPRMIVTGKGEVI